LGNVAPALSRRHSNDLVARAVAEVAVAGMGAALLICAFVANRRFLDRHFVPSFFLSRHVYVVLQTCGRFFMAALGVSLALIVRPRRGGAPFHRSCFPCFRYLIAGAAPFAVFEGSRMEYSSNSKTPHASFALHTEAVTSPSSQCSPKAYKR
jgi:hypothetical protein